MLEFNSVTDESGEFDMKGRYFRFRIPIWLIVRVPFMEIKSEVICLVECEDMMRVEQNAGEIRKKKRK